MNKAKQTTQYERQPVVAVMGHVDHGKSTLLDYIRKENVVATEAGGITQHVSAYEVTHEHEGRSRSITFLDTPGHASFSAIRTRGSKAADIAILVVAADDGVKEQTKEALGAIKEAGIPFIVAINKIDKPDANIERAKQSLLENEIYLEGLGGDIPWAGISAKAGTGIPELLDLILLVADLNELTADPKLPGEGVIIETNLDAKRGVAATLIVQNGTVKSGTCVLSGSVFAPVRIMENFAGQSVKEAHPGMPIVITGWSGAPVVGEQFVTVPKKKDAEKAIAEYLRTQESSNVSEEIVSDIHVTVPIVLRADTQGSIDAIQKEISTLKTDRISPKLVQSGIGSINEKDVKIALGDERTLLVSFNTNADSAARDLAERSGIAINSFNIIYELTDWIQKEIVKRTPRVKEKEVRGAAKVLRVFSNNKNVWVIGGRVKDGTLSVGDKVTLTRRDHAIGEGVIKNIQSSKKDVPSISTGEFGAQIGSKLEIVEGDTLESFVIVEK